ncbi:HAMP domain-containing sensor histidine kinase [Sulfurimonas sp. HSL3-7]|uniref:sensor histidine kinase n=1 Tax=Sulfonitrofixus jiaomeiensis TaxID=3131938 RepID=UPI0031F8F72E
MHQHEKRSFWKIFLAYFGSVALLILLAGHFYYKEQYQQRIKDEHFAIIEYARHLKMNEPIVSADITHEIVKKEIKHFSMDTLIIKENYFEKYIPNNWHESYLYIKKDTRRFKEHISALKQQIIVVQLLLLSLFALISLLLTNSALRPMKEMIFRLDKFTKDLIHDLNTPLTTIKLNLKLLEKDAAYPENKALKRIGKSAYEISELHQNLTVLLEEDTFLLEEIDVCTIAAELLCDYEAIYPALRFKTACSALKSNLNETALKQILHNLLSNACRYNRENGHINIWNKGKTLYIQDSGTGITNPERIFERNYSEQSSSGIGLDIVKRLCDAMKIKISVDSSANGTTISLTFS